MRMLEELYPAFTGKLREIDCLERPLDDKTLHEICFALSIKGRSAPALRQHYRAALRAGATTEEMAYIVALTMRIAAESDDTWVHDMLWDWEELAGMSDENSYDNGACCC